MKKAFTFTTISFSTLTLALAVLTTGCGNPANFAPMNALGDRKISSGAPETPPAEGTPSKVQDEFLYTMTTDLFKQDQYDQNRVRVLFEAKDALGNTAGGIDKSQVILNENSRLVKNFEVKASVREEKMQVDIVFAIDITGSMQDIINTVKQRVTYFVNEFSKQNIKANLCLVTFKDLVEKQCTRFTEDDAKTPINENLQAFIDEVSKLKASGGDNPSENSLGAIEAAAKNTPWHKDAQRMVILVSDTRMFWFSPANRGEAGMAAPNYDQVLNLLRAQQVNVFPVTPSTHGYDYKFFKSPSIPEVTKGKFFNIDDIISGKSSFDEVFKYIAGRFYTQYLAEYIVEENDLNPTTPVSNRNIKLDIKDLNPTFKVKVLSVTSNLPSGRPEYKNEFILRSAAKPQTVAVLINGNLMTNGFTVTGDKIKFDKFPPAGSEIRVSYEGGKLRDNVRVHSISLGKKRPVAVKVTLNNIAVDSTFFTVTKTVDGEYLLDLTEAAFDESDPVLIRHNAKLHVLVEYINY